MVEAMDEQERFTLREKYGSAKEVGSIILEGLLDAAAEGAMWIAEKIDKNIYGFEDDD